MIPPKKSSTQFDPTWENPSPAQEAAFLLAESICEKHRPAGMSVDQLASFIFNAKTSFWYTQARVWAMNPPQKFSKGFSEACNLIVLIVDNGYNANTKLWWSLTDFAILESSRLALKHSLVHLGEMLREYRRSSMVVVSSGFDPFIEIMCGHNWENKYKRRSR